MVRELARIREIRRREHGRSALFQFAGDTILQSAIETAIGKKPIECERPAGIVRPRPSRLAGAGDMLRRHLGDGTLGERVLPSQQPGKSPAFHVIGGAAARGVAGFQQRKASEGVGISD